MARSHGKAKLSSQKPPGLPRGRRGQTEKGKISMKLQNLIHIVVGIVLVLGFCLKRERLPQHRTGAILRSLLQKGLKRFKASPPVLETQGLAGERSFPTRLPASTPVLARECYCSIRLTQIRQLAM